MALCNQLFAAVAVCAVMLSAMPADVAAQQTTTDGILTRECSQ